MDILTYKYAHIYSYVTSQFPDKVWKKFFIVYDPLQGSENIVWFLKSFVMSGNSKFEGMSVFIV